MYASAAAPYAVRSSPFGIVRAGQADMTTTSAPAPAPAAVSVWSLIPRDAYVAGAATLLGVVVGLMAAKHARM